MKNKMTKLFAVLMTFCMLLGAIMVPVSADGEAVQGAIEPDTTWYDPNKDTYYLYDAADLLGFSYLGSTGLVAEGEETPTRVNFEGKTIKLMANIDLNPGWDASTEYDTTAKTVTKLATAPTNVWTAIPVFKGTFEGNGRTISGIYTYTDFAVPASSIKTCGGFVNELIGGEVKNLIVKNSLAFFESTSAAADPEATGTGRIHIGGFISHVQDASLNNLYVDMDAWVEFDYHFTFGGMICAFGTTAETREFDGAVENIVFAGTTGVISTDDSMEYNSSGKRSDSSKVRYGGMIAANISWDSPDQKDVTLTMKNVAFTGAQCWPGKASGDAILCYTSGGAYNRGIGVDNAGFYMDHVASGDNADLISTTTLTEVADNIFNNKNASGNESDTYEQAGWKSVTVSDNAAYANGRGLDTILLPGTVVDMLTSTTHPLYVQKSADGAKVRFVGVVNLDEADFANFQKLGFEISMTYNGNTYQNTYTTTSVYKSLKVGDDTVEATAYGGTYFYAIEITGLDSAQSDVVFTVNGIAVQTLNSEEVTSVYGSGTHTYEVA